MTTRIINKKPIRVKNIRSEQLLYNYKNLQKTQSLKMLSLLLANPAQTTYHSQSIAAIVATDTVITQTNKTSMAKLNCIPNIHNANYNSYLVCTTPNRRSNRICLPLHQTMEDPPLTSCWINILHLPHRVQDVAKINHHCRAHRIMLKRTVKEDSRQQIKRRTSQAC